MNCNKENNYTFYCDLNSEIRELTGNHLEYNWNKTDDNTLFLMDTFDNEKAIIFFLKVRFKIKIENDLYFDNVYGFYDRFIVLKGLKLYKKFKKISTMKTSITIYKKILIMEIEKKIKKFIIDIFNFWNHYIYLNNKFSEIKLKHFKLLVHYLNNLPENYNNPNPSIDHTGCGYKCHFCKTNNHYNYYAWKCSKTNEYCKCNCSMYDHYHDHYHDNTVGFLWRKWEPLSFQLDVFENYLGVIIHNQDWKLKEYVIKKGIVILELKEYLLGISLYDEAKVLFEASLNIL